MKKRLIEPDFYEEERMAILFITDNQDKLRQVRALIPDVQGVDMDLAELQESDAQKIITALKVRLIMGSNGRLP